MMRTSLCMAAIALLCSTSAIAQTTGSGSMGAGSTTPGQTGSGQTSPEMGDPSTQQPPTESGTMGGQSGTMGGQSGTMGGTGQEATGQSAMESGTGQNQNFAAFDQNQDGSLDRTEFARALQVQGSAPAAGGEAGTPSRQTMRGDRAISPLNQSSVEFQRADTNSDGKVSQEEFSSFSPQK